MFYHASGSITQNENITYKKYLGGKTKNRYVAATWQYRINTAKCEFHDCPVIHFRHANEEHEDDGDTKCFSMTWQGLGLDSRSIVLSPVNTQSGLNKKCFVAQDRFICEGSIRTARAFDGHLHATLGYRCQRNIRTVLDVEYNISITGYSAGEIPCTDWDDALDELQQPVPSGLTSFVNQCSVMYPRFSKWNIVGMTQHQLEAYHLFLLVEFPCYQRFLDIICRMVLPECSNGSVIFPCADMCWDFNTACDDFTTLDCTVFKNSTDQQSSQCFNKPCSCKTSDIRLPSHAVIGSDHTGIQIATNVLQVHCQSPFATQKPIFNAACGYDGHWHYSSYDVASQCNPIDLTVIVAISIASMTIPMLAVVCCCVLYRYWFRNRFCLTCLRIRRACFRIGIPMDDKDAPRSYDAFVSYEIRDISFVDSHIVKPLSKSDLKLAVDYNMAGLGISASRLEDICTLIAKSRCIIVVLTQDYVQGNRCKFELDYAVSLQRREGRLKVIFVLTEPMEYLERCKLSRRLKILLNACCVVEAGDRFFLQKLMRLLHGIDSLCSSSAKFRLEETTSSLF